MTLSVSVIQERAELPVYHEYGPYSYFQDRFHAEARHSEDAETRLQQHAAEYRRARADIERRAANVTMTSADGNEHDFEVRANWTPGQGGYFAPPLWLIERFADIPRPQQVLGRLIPKAHLPRGAQSINVPVLTSSTDTAPEALDGSDPDVDLAGTASENQVVTIEGMEDFPLQMLEQSPQGAHLDYVIFKTLQAGFDEELERQLLVGTGVGQLLGLLNVPGRNKITYSEPAKGTTLYPVMGKAMAAIGNNRKVPPQAWICNTSRWAWISTSETTTEAPLLITDNVGSMFPIGSLVAVNTYLSDAISTNTNGEVPMLLCIPQDCLVLESDPVMRLMREPLTGTLQGRIEMHRYVAALTNLYPSGIATITGTGMVPVAGF